LLLGGTLGDRYGRRRVFVIGVIWFAAASVLCGLAPSALWLVIARALQGVGAALLTPGSLAYLHPDVLLSSFREAVIISGVLCLAGGLLAALTIKNPTGTAGRARPYDRELHCALDAPPLRGEHHALQAGSR